MDFLSQKIDELKKRGYCVLKAQFDPYLIDKCRAAFVPVLTAYLDNNSHLPNRGKHRHYLPMPFEKPCFHPTFFFDKDILFILTTFLGDKIVADQWGCDVPLSGSDYQSVHVDYQRPLFSEIPDLLLPAHMMVISFGLDDINPENGAIEIAPGTHNMVREEAFDRVKNSAIPLVPVSLNPGDVLIRHPWALHRGTPNRTDTPRSLLTIRYVRNWYHDSSRQVNAIPPQVWNSLTNEQKEMLCFPIQFS